MAWWLAYEELYGDMDKEYPIMNKDIVTTIGGESEDTVTFNVPEGAVGAADTISLDLGDASTDTLNFGTPLPGGMGEDRINFSSGAAGTAFDDPKYYATPYTSPFRDDSYPTVGGGNTASESDGLNLNVDPGLTVGMDDVYAHHFPGTETLNLNVPKPAPDLNFKPQKYEEDKGIADLKDYVSSTYRGHYTNKNSDTQTLDLIHSVGDAESFCRSNALKYLSRYDKKGSAKQDILKAMHYCLLLYYFSGNTKEPDYTNTRYETF